MNEVQPNFEAITAISEKYDVVDIICSRWISQTMLLRNAEILRHCTIFLRRARQEHPREPCSAICINMANDLCGKWRTLY